MLSAEYNQLVTQVEPGTPCGNLIRHYWQPAALKEELTDHRAAKAVRLMGEDLVLFQDDNGSYGLVERRCPHRGADLFYGRLEDGGLRCLFHGWLFDVNGRCLEQPAEPPGSTFHTKVNLKSYPCREVNGIIFAYMGPWSPPALPYFDCFIAPDSHSFAFKGYLECNWLQAVEVGIDPSHASFLHRYLKNYEPEYGMQFGGKSGDSQIAMTTVLREFTCPEINVEETEYGMRLVTTRELDNSTVHVRVTNMIYPNLIVIPMTNDMCISQWHVPIDDTHSYWYAVFTSFNKEVDKLVMRDQRLELFSLPEYKSRANKANNYCYNPEEQRTKTFTGMGMDINVHDQWAVESPGPIYDRTSEHLGAADKGIIAYRKSLIKAIENLADGKSPPFTLSDNEAGNFRGPMAIDTTVKRINWQEDWKIHDKLRRKNSHWAEGTGT